MDIRAALIIAVAGLAVAAQVPQQTALGDGSHHQVASLVRGVLARHEAVFSGRFVYRRVTVSTTPEGDTKCADERVRFSLMGDSWALRYTLKGEATLGSSTAGTIASEVVQLNHKGSLVEYSSTNTEIDQEGETRKATQDYATLQTARPVDLDNEPPPYFAGTFWHKKSADYVKNNRSRARFAGVDEIDGVPVSIVEWEVPTEEIFDAFHATNDLLKNGGLLRLYVAPSLGHALPRIEHVAPSGEVHATYESSGFREVAKGLFFPQETSRHTTGTDRVSGFTWRYAFEQIDDVNEPIAEGDFLAVLPEGTDVADLREPGRQGITLSHARESVELPEGPPLLSQVADKRSAWRAWVIGASTVIIVVIVVLAVFRRRGKRSSC